MTNTRARSNAAPVFVEEGAAFRALTNLGTEEARSSAEDGGQTRTAAPERFDVVVVGAGQSGLSVGYHLAKRGLRFVILDANERVGDAWRKRWDSLRLFTPAGFNGLAGMPFPAHPHYFPTKDEMGDYLEVYAKRFELPVRTGTRVKRLSRRGERYVVETEAGATLEADHVVVAMANYQKPKVPDFARDLDPSIRQIHSRDYKNPSQLREGGVLIVGAGNSGAEIAKDVAKSHRTVVSGRDTGAIPFRIDGFFGRLFLVRLVIRFIFHRVLTVRTPIGRKVRDKVLHHGGPLIRTKNQHLRAAGVERVGRTAGVQGGRPVLDDGRALDVTNVIWCTGFHPGFEWIDLPIFDDIGDPRHEEGVAVGEPGLYFCGLHFLYSLSSAMVHAAARDSARVVDTIAHRQETPTTIAA